MVNGKAKPVALEIVTGDEPITVNAVQVVEPEQVTEVVATLAKVLLPEKYGIFPMTAALEVDNPSNESALPVNRIGNEVERTPCFPFSVV